MERGRQAMLMTQCVERIQHNQGVLPILVLMHLPTTVCVAFQCLQHLLAGALGLHRDITTSLPPKVLLLYCQHESLCAGHLMSRVVQDASEHDSAEPTKHYRLLLMTKKADSMAEL